MRISTYQFFTLNSTNITRTSSNLNDQVAYLSAGKRVLTAKDDSISTGRLLGLKDELSAIEKYQKNIIQVQNRSTVEETSLANVEDIFLKARQLFIQGNNGSLSVDDKLAVAEEMRNLQEQLIDIANSKDEGGNYVFSGYQVNKQPFTLQADGSVNYQGDKGQRALQIASNVVVELNQSGHEVFLNSNNAIGDFEVAYTPGANEGGLFVTNADVTNRGTHNDANAPYTFTFTSPTDLTVTDNTATTVFNTTTYSPGQDITFNGMTVTVDGSPLPGDQFVLSPENKASIFDSIGDALKWLESPASTAFSTQHQVDYDHILNQLNSDFNHLTTKRSDAGLRLNQANRQKDFHLDYQLSLEQARSQIEDLDYAAAITQFEQTQLSLQAAQQSFSQIQGLSLFNYI